MDMAMVITTFIMPLHSLTIKIYNLCLVKIATQQGIIKSLGTRGHILL